LFYQNTKTIIKTQIYFSMQKVKKNNKLQLYYLKLSNNTPPIAKKFLEDVCAMCGISATSFYRKIKSPQNFTQADKNAIAIIAGKKVTELF
jgi:hypothetical protein